MNKHSEEYLQYLKSEKWQRKRKQRLEIDDYRCCMCGTVGNMENKIEVHHMNYKTNFGSEDAYKELVCLCHSCHILVHRMLNRPTDPCGVSWWKQNTPEVHEYNFRDTISRLGG